MQETDTFFCVGPVRKINEFHWYLFNDPALLVPKQVYVDAELPGCFSTAFAAHRIQCFDVFHLPIILVMLFRV